jgi:tetratricopeptide (TPR) repeat protein
MAEQTTDEEQIGIPSDYLTYKRQKCFVAYSENAPWAQDLLSACAETLKPFDLEVDYATKHYDAEVPLHEKARQLIANARCGIYDLSYWPDRKGNWQLPRNVFIELGMAIALNRPALMVRHASNRNLELPECLQSVAGHIVEWSGDATLEERLSKLLPEWLETSPKEDWLDLFCKFGHRVCNFRKADPRSRQWGQKDLPGHVSDGPDLDRPDFRKAVAKVLGRYSDLQITYLDALPIQRDYQFLLCSYCQTVRSTSFAVHRLTRDSPPETFIGIGIALALEKQFGYAIPKLLLGASKDDLPSLLGGYEIAPAANSTEIKESLGRFMPEVIQKVRRVVWEPRILPFIEVKRSKAAEISVEVNEVQRLLALAESAEREGRFDAAIEAYKAMLERNPSDASTHYTLGEAYVNVGNLSAATTSFESAIKLDPENLFASERLAQVLLRQNRYEEAMVAFESAIKLDPHVLPSWLGLLKAEKATRQFQSAERDYLRAIAIFPDEVDLRIGLGGVLQKQNLNEAAETIYRDTIRDFPHLPLVRNRLASLLVTRGRRTEARELYRETLDLFPDDRTAKANLAELASWFGGTRKIRIYDLAKELKLDTKRLIEEIRGEGVDVSVPSHSVSKELAEEIRLKYFPKKETVVKRAVRVVKRTRSQPIEDEDDAEPRDLPPHLSATNPHVKRLYPVSDPKLSALVIDDRIADLEEELVLNQTSSPELSDHSVDEADLVARLAAGDKEAFNLVYERFSRIVSAYMRIQVRDRDLAEDLTQETFVRVFRQSPSLRGNTKLRPWILDIAMNVARTRLKSQRGEAVEADAVEPVENSMRQFLNEKSNPKDSTKRGFPSPAIRTRSKDLKSPMPVWGSGASSGASIKERVKRRPAGLQDIDQALSGESKSVYVGNLPPGTNEADLSRLFSPIGPVRSVTIPRDPKTKLSRGFAFVEMSNAGAARKAITELRNTELMGSKLILFEARAIRKKGADSA